VLAPCNPWNTQSIEPEEPNMRVRTIVGACVLVLFQVPVYAQEPAAAGRIKIASGSVSIVRAGAAIPAPAGQVLYETDAIRTGADGRVGLTLQDDTRISLGPASEVRLDKFSYAPADGRLAVVLNFVRGVAAYVSGRIAKLAPDSVRLQTPAAIVGVRGTSLAIRVGVE
jgi:hypothetical protein